MIFKSYIAFAITTALAAGAAAQGQPDVPAAVNEKAASAIPLYQSAFADYKGFQEPEIRSWRAANDQVRDAGGVSGHDMSKMSGAAAMPGHDMQSMSPDAAGQTTSPGPGTSPTTNRSSMSDHNMGKMIAAPVPPGGKTAAPDKARSQQKATPPHDMGKMKQAPGAVMDMPGHDMATMGKGTPTQPKPPAPEKAKKPNTEVPPKMMDHSKMKNKE